MNEIPMEHLERAARGMCDKLRAVFPDLQITLLENVMQFVWNGMTVQVMADSFWAHPTVVCWFVNASHSNGNFMHCEGTPLADRALIDVGTAIEFAMRSGDPIRDERG